MRKSERNYEFLCFFFPPHFYTKSEILNYVNYIYFIISIILISIDQNLVDWSIRGQIAVSFGHDVIIWQSKEDITMAFDIKCPRSLAYSPDGEFLAIGCKSCEYPGKCNKDNTETIMLNNF